MWEVTDTFNDFLIYWATACSKPLPEQIELWQTSYMAKYPELLEKQLEDYGGQGLDWRDIATERVFPKLAEHLPLMRKARDNLLKVCGSIYEQAAQVLGFDFDITFVIYVGLGCGAGWATQYGGRPACLFGLENIAECEWHHQARLRGLTAHELGHLAHMAWRNEWDSFAKAERDPLFLLYSEGFAQRCEHLILGCETWHQMQSENWPSWCQQHKAWLAKEYLRRVDEGIAVNDFFGSWLDIQGRRQTGYFLGHEFIRWLEKEHDMRKISTFTFQNVKEPTVEYLRLVADEFA